MKVNIISKVIKTEVIACCDGQLIDISQVNDDMFSQKIIGDGFAIIPTSNVIHSPIEGIVTMIAPTKHAFGIRNNDGLEILVHIGIDTVTLNGDGFNFIVEKNIYVAKGSPIVEVDFKKIVNNGFDPVVICVLTNRAINITETQISTDHNVNMGEVVCCLEYSGI